MIWTVVQALVGPGLTGLSSRTLLGPPLTALGRDRRLYLS